MTPAWTYPVTDWRTGQPVADHVPIRCDYFDDALGVGVGTLVGSLPVKGSPVDPDDVLAPWRRVIWPCRDGRPFGAYVVTKHGQYGPKSTTIPFTAQRVDSVFARREIWSTLVFRQVDQLLIARQLIAYAMGLFPSSVDINYLAILQQLPLAARIPWLRVDEAMSGVLRDRLDDNDGYQAATHKTIAAVLTALTELEDGFDYRLDYGRDPDTGALSATVRLGYPQLGSDVPVIPLEYPGNVVTWTQAATADDTVTMAKTFGAGQGVEHPESVVVSDETAHNQGWPLLMGSESSTATVQDTLDANSRAFLAEQAGVWEGFTAQLDRTALGSYDLGDPAALRISDPRWGTRESVVRITGHRVEPSRPGRAERVTPTLVEV